MWGYEAKLTSVFDTSLSYTSIRNLSDNIAAKTSHTRGDHA
jgi:hypothetical protein